MVPSLEKEHTLFRAIIKDDIRFIPCYLALSPLFTFAL